MKLLVLLAAACVGAPAFAQVQPPSAPPVQQEPVKKGARDHIGLFIGGGLESLAYAFEAPNGDSAGGYGYAALQARAGVVFNKYLSLEAQTSLGVYGYEFDGDGQIYEDTDIDLGSNYGVFLVPRLPIGEIMGLYARLGWVETELEGPSGQPFRGSGPSYGLGIGIDVNSLTIGFDLTVNDLEFRDNFPGNFDSAGASFATTLSKRF